MQEIPEHITPQRSLGERIALGTVWIMGARMLVRMLGLINTLILARLLVPEDFGLVAIGITLMQLLQNISDIGVRQTVIRFQTASESMIDTVFTLSVLRGGVVMLVMLALVPFAPALFDDDRTAAVVLAISITPFILGLKNPKFYELERQLDFTRTFQLDAAVKVISVAVSIFIAVTFRTYWAIIIGIIAGALTETALSYFFRSYRPRLSFAAIREVFGFSGWVAAVSFITALNNKLDVLIMPKLTGPAATGAFYIGHQIADIPTEEIAAPMARAVYPGLSELQEKQGEMNKTFLQGIEVLAAIGLPAALGCALVAADLVAILLGQNWLAVIPVFQIYAPAAGLVMLFMSLEGFAMARDRTHLIVWREVAYFCVRTPLLIWAASAYGLIGAIWATAIGATFNSCMSLLVYQKVSGRPFWCPIWQIRRTVFACSMMTLWFIMFRPLIPFWPDLPVIIRLAADVMLGGVVYCATHFLIWRLSGQPNGVEQQIRRYVTGFLANRKQA
ncbi:lipopolysaccharide biosynthesis protein [Parvularcula sp. IMCC14364]|uniref:lipopolysaccharide biosynthesis protein n=1 Tax=Parvularcula sp. IMCC14364 TaxID=3067902 RepID=UPI0027404B80|nr:lipopolysaccharide biosynthesis protein [Parvularcula sp. IMCC14364]